MRVSIFLRHPVYAIAIAIKAEGSGNSYNKLTTTCPYALASFTCSSPTTSAASWAIPIF